MRAAERASSLARRKIEAAQLALARSRKFSPIFCTLAVEIVTGSFVVVFVGAGVVVVSTILVVEVIKGPVVASIFVIGTMVVSETVVVTVPSEDVFIVKVLVGIAIVVVIDVSV